MLRENSTTSLKEQYPNLKEATAQKQGDRVRVLLEMDPRQIEEIKKSAVEQALETIRNRVDQFGVAEPDISRQGENKILIQLPGIKDPDRAKDLIGKTALLEFKLVDEDSDLGRALAGNVPFGDVLLYQRIEDPKTGSVRKIPYLIKDKTLMTGDALKDAQVSLGQNNIPYIGISFHPAGARDFEQVTTENVGKRLAIILDNNVYSAPVIKQPISGGEAVIEGRFSLEEARDLAIVLRAGSLPAPIMILEERTVGPSLGQDSINNGIKATMIGGLLVILAMMAYYRMAGFVANIALTLNMLLLLAALAVLRGTLTLPGIAGIALTLGMAVDANVLIFERIREEMRLGKPPGAALEAGYTRAFLTIMDSNVTTVVAALVLLQFGTGTDQGVCHYPDHRPRCQHVYRDRGNQVHLRLRIAQYPRQAVEHLRAYGYVRDHQTGDEVRFHAEEVDRLFGLRHRHRNRHRQPDRAGWSQLRH